MKYSSLAFLAKLAFNADFSYYVNGAIMDADLPIDPSMNWAQWIDAVFKRKAPNVPEDIRDEAIHDMLLHIFFERKVLQGFDPTWLSASTQEKPLEKQVASYVKTCIILNYDSVQRYLNKAYALHDEMALSDVTKNVPEQDQSHAVEQLLPAQEPDTEILETEIDKLRAAFKDWLTKTNYVKGEDRDLASDLFDIVVTFEGNKSELIGELAQRNHLGLNQARGFFYSRMPKILRRFLTSAAGSGFNLATQIPNVKKELDSEESLQPALTASSITPTKGAQTQEQNKMASNYKKFQMLASKDPQALTEAIRQLTAGFVELAGSATAFQDNLGLNRSAKQAGMNKFARMQRYAADQPELVEDAVNELYNDADKLMEGLETLAGNLGFTLSEQPEMDVEGEIPEEPVEE